MSLVFADDRARTRGPRRLATAAPIGTLGLWHRTEVGVVATRGNVEKARYALDAEAQILPFYNDYFGTPYPLPNLDNVAGPGQSVYVEVGQPHRITNMHDEVLVIVETQLGSYLGEDDICRLEDDYGRTAPAPARVSTGARR